MQDDQSRQFNKNGQDKPNNQFKNNGIQQSGQIRHNQFKEAVNSSSSFISAAATASSREIKNKLCNNNNHL